ncbi:MAG: phenylacetate--CoA ligase family protein [Myxococcota bacterium]|nr:phenylacetate--CoA ligase family protein [Myxococcota bacterium]
MNWRRPILGAIATLSGSRIINNLHKIKALDTGSPADLRRFQEEKLAQLVTHAWQHVPYYREVLEGAGVIKNGHARLNNFNRVPILTKDIVKKAFDNLTSLDCKKRQWFYNTSGGSTGEPVRFIQDKAYADWNYANKIYYKTYAHQVIGDKELRLWGSERDLMVGQEHIKTRLVNYLYNRKELNTFKMTLADLSRYVQIWNAYQPRWVESYVDGMVEFATYVEKRGIPMHAPAGILTSTGTLFPEMRDKIKSVFGCGVYNRYGSREVGDMACSCDREAGMHLSPWHHYLEILDTALRPVGPGEMGKVYVTALNNYSMPIIRYDIGDFARSAKSGEETCECGRAAPVIDAVEGREMSIFRTRDGRVVPGQYFIHFLGVVLNKGHIKKFQLVQKDYEEVNVKVVVSNRQAFEQSKGQIVEITKKVMGTACKVYFEETTDIPPLASGKYIYTVCELPEMTGVRAGSRGNTSVRGPRR